MIFRRYPILFFFGMGIAPLSAQDNAKGYYKDLFVDGGISVSSRDYLPSAQFLQLSMESFLCSAQKSTDTTAYSAMDTLMQHQLIGGSPMDENGVLLYPDGAPRFRMIFMNGGLASRHGKSLGATCRHNLRQYVRNGGSYVGSCAGAFIASRAVKGDSALKYLDSYIGLWPGLTISTGIHDSRTRLDLDSTSPLLRYHNFGGHMYVDDVYHNGGGFAVTETDWPEQTEVLARYNIEGRNFNLKWDIQGRPAIWAYKANPYSGRVIMCGSHPEFVSTGERLELMCAMVKYALVGNGTPSIKGELVNGQPRHMWCETHDDKPAFARIGDRQYHHFTLSVAPGTKQVTLHLQPRAGYDNYDLFLLADTGKFAYLETAAYKILSKGIEKKLVIDNPRAGTLYVSVFCNTTVESTRTRYGTQYTGRLEVLNGIPYTISTEF